jgi:hypothetical protein
MSYRGRKLECHSRSLTYILLGHYLPSRGDDRRPAEISNLSFTFESKAEGSTCRIVIDSIYYICQQTKSIWPARSDCSLRYKTPLICMRTYNKWANILPSLLLKGDFSKRYAWCDICPTKGRQGILSYSSQCE